MTVKDLGPRTAPFEPGLLVVFGNQVWVLFEGVGVVWSAAHGPLMGFRDFQV